MNAAAADALPAVLAVDGGNSKAELALVAADGRVLAHAVGPTISHQAVGLERGMTALADLVERAASEAGRRQATPIAATGVFCLAGADSPIDVRRLRRAIAALRVARDVDVRSDTEAPLRAGTDGWGVAVVCGTGINAIGRAPDGRTARFAGLGLLSGDFAGGGAMGLMALGAAAAAQERRGPRTALERIVPAHFGRRRALDVSFAVEHGHLPRSALRDLAPDVFAAAGGDAVARGIVEHVADQIVAFAGAAIERLRLADVEVPVVLSGGILRTTDAAFHERVGRGIAGVAPRALVSVLSERPVLGAALLGLDAVGAGSESISRLRRAFEERPDRSR